MSHAPFKPSAAFRIYALGLFGVFGNPLVLPLLPFIMVEFAITPLELGLMITLFALPSIIVVPAYGVLVDRLGRKPLLLISLAGCVVSSWLCATAPNYQTLLFWRAVQGLCVTPVEAMVNTLITDNYQGEQRRARIGNVTSFMYLCGAAYPLLATLMLSVFGWRSALLVPVGIGLCLIPLFMWSPMAYVPSPNLRLTDFARQVRTLLLSQSLLALFLVRVLFSCIIFGVVYPHLALLLTDKLHVAPTMAGIMFAVAAMAISLGCFALNAQARRFPPWLIGLLCGLEVAAGMLCLLLAQGLWLMVVGLVMYGFGIGTLVSLTTVMVAELATPDTRATIFAANSTVFRTTQAVSPPLFGLVFSQGGFDIVFGLGVIIAAVLACVASLTFNHVAAVRCQDNTV